LAGLSLKIFVQSIKKPGNTPLPGSGADAIFPTDRNNPTDTKKIFSSVGWFQSVGDFLIFDL